MSIDRLTEIFRETFDDESIVLNRDLAAKDVKDWNSFNHINLMIAIETEFDVVLQPQEVQAAGSVGDLVDLLKTKGCDLDL